MKQSRYSELQIDTWNSKEMQMSQALSDCHSMVVQMVLSNQTSYPLIRILN
jgi:hypothetical protein